jgi:hypothetical protein
MRIGGEAPRRRTHSRNRFQNRGLLRVTATSDRHRTLTMFCSSASERLVFSKSSPSRRSQYDASRNLASGYQTPQGNQQFARQSYDYCFAVSATLSSSPIPLGQCTVLLKEQKAPSQLNHSAAYSCVARLGEPFLSPFAAALVGCASETSIARYGSSIPQFPREDLVHQHVRRFYTNTNNAGDQSDHRVWSITGRLLHTLQTSLLDLADLITDEPPALHVAMQLS